MVSDISVPSACRAFPNGKELQQRNGRDRVQDMSQFGQCRVPSAQEQARAMHLTATQCHLAQLLLASFMSPETAVLAEGLEGRGARTGPNMALASTF